MSELRTEKLCISFGGLKATNNVDFHLKSGDIVGIIGPNGAGKTTLINLIAGIHAPSSGKIYLDDVDITNIPTHIRAAMGIGRTFQLIHPLENLTLIENVMTGFIFARKMSVPEARIAAIELCLEMGLERLNRSTANLNILEIKKMEIAKALATDPKILFLDEVMAGLNSDESKEVIALIKDIALRKSLAVGVVEHVMGVISSLTNRVIVLDNGILIAQGPYTEVSKNERVRTAYLGGAE
ncbi:MULTISPECIES: ABC transporter ATP-binding protein [unclassified Oceanispirochaeta]|uniref:ABC transporter ATP-binding protein n=1 Tax=unclassified Oceanispirochaeta TaxID=2635722 RepID=UPI000E0974E5|nr:MULTISPECIES: ABC transporter ATP-binding protein [unclassified Oceanispirochaeta]MBF9018154.1 ABC transporter ATP-binding protein [Oceanispirochaeta sp. M2]NPD74618.1 ABC transporter ATP-binding protein [Oceanispirochaeta sp. M1]RDG29569.1 ABC transporter ATP-binding protein [Oceanispirochaeta sp. M1]